MESTEAKALRSAVRIVEAPESQSITHVTRTGPLDLRRDALAEDANAQTLDELRDLELAKVALIQVITRKKATLADIANRRTHISALPPEILSMILTEGYRLLTQERRAIIINSQFSSRINNPTTYLVAVSSVCRRWRDTALSTSGLWTELDLSWSPSQCRVWVARSGTTRSLDLHGSSSLDRNHGVTRDADSFGAIAPALHRWRSLSLQQSSQATVTRVFQRINEVPYTCDRLQEIEIKSQGSSYARSPDHTKLDSVLWSSHASNETINPKTLFPHLRNVTLLPGQFSLWGMLLNVVHLELHHPGSMSWQEWHSVLTEATALETLRITSQCEIPVGSPLVLQLDRLRTLDIGTASHDAFIQYWLQNVNAPFLSNLLFEHSWRPEDTRAEDAEWLCDFISRLPRLTALTLRAENDYVSKVLTLLSSDMTPALAVELEELCLFTNKTSHDQYPRESIRDIVTRHLRSPDNYRALDTLILSNDEDRAWLEPYVGNLRQQDKPAPAFYHYHIPDYSGYHHIASDEEGDEDEEDEEEEEDAYGYPYSYDDDLHEDEDDLHLEPEDLEWLVHGF